MAIESSSSLPEQGAHIPERTSDETYRTLVLLFDGTGDKYVIYIWVTGCSDKSFYKG